MQSYKTFLNGIRAAISNAVNKIDQRLSAAVSKAQATADKAAAMTYLLEVTEDEYESVGANEGCITLSASKFTELFKAIESGSHVMLAIDDRLINGELSFGDCHMPLLYVFAFGDGKDAVVFAICMQLETITSLLIGPSGSETLSAASVATMSLDGDTESTPFASLVAKLRSKQSDSDDA